MPEYAIFRRKMRRRRGEGKKDAEGDKEAEAEKQSKHYRLPQTALPLAHTRTALMLSRL